MDSDMLVLDDISKLFAMRDENYAAMVVKNPLKFEWASLVLFNCSKCRILTPDYIETAEKLHFMEWADDVGGLPPEWNHLVGYDAPRDNAKIVHFTQGLPCHAETQGCEYSTAWDGQFKRCISTMPWVHLMGQSVHAKPVYDRLDRKGQT